MIKEHFKKNLVEYISVAILLALTFLIMIVFFKLWNMDITVPTTYTGGDDAGLLVNAKMLTQQGWCLSTDRLGTPFGGDYYDFTANVMHNFDLITLKIFAMVTGNAAVAFNLEYFSIFIFASLISYFVMRELKITNWISICGSLTFAFSPFIIMRGTQHIVLSTCYFVPLSILLCIWIYERDDILCFNKHFFKNKRNWFVILFVILIANNGIAYYQFFTCFLLFVTGISKLIKTKKLKFLLKSIAATAGIVLCMLVNMIPIFIYTSTHGDNPLAVIRGGFVESEIYGLKLIQLFLPVDGHGLNWLCHIINYYNNSTIYFNENITSYIGVMGICGLLFSLTMIFMKKKTDVFNRLTLMSELNLMMILLATGSGIGTMFAFVISAKIRGYNRISIFIAYVSILVFCIGLNAFYQKYKKKWIIGVGILFTAICLWEQIPAGYIPDYGIIKTDYESDELFVQNIEDSVSEGAMIYQLPYHEYPESGMVNQMSDYQLFVGYIHSDKLKWSYGAIKGREADTWLDNASNLPVQRLAVFLKKNGFEGIYIDRRAYSAADVEIIENKLSSITKYKPIYSNNGNLSFFKL